MFTNLLFVILVLLLLNFSVELPIEPWIASPWTGFLCGLALYLFLLALIYYQKRKSLILINLELLIFLALFIFILGGHRLFAWPSQALMTMVCLSFYLFGLWFYHYARGVGESPCAEATLELRMVIPFTLPFLFFTLLIDLSSPFEYNLSSTAVFLISVLFLAGIMILFPPVLQWIWQCRPLPSSELTHRLEALCQKAHFRHAGMRLWSILPHATTAAIIGVMPQFRYVMFTEGLLRNLSPEEIEAVLAHEIGHSYRKHLILYPLIIFGMLACVSLYSYFFGDFINNPSLYPFTVYIPYAVIIALYFRFVFGFFSRQFEREADLHIFKLGVPVDAMQNALLATAHASGTPPTEPSWHHYSVQERVDFLARAAQNPAMIARHHRKVKLYFALYLLFLGLTTFFIYEL
jgi:Zn-dependent protease with chaperone function